MCLVCTGEPPSSGVKYIYQHWYHQRIILPSYSKVIRDDHIEQQESLAIDQPLMKKEKTGLNGYCCIYLVYFLSHIPQGRIGKAMYKSRSSFSKLKMHISCTRIIAAAWKWRPNVVDVELNPLAFYMPKRLFKSEIVLQRSQCEFTLSLFIEGRESITLFVWDSNREWKRTDLDFEDEIRAYTKHRRFGTRASSVDKDGSLSTDEALVPKRLSFAYYIISSSKSKSVLFHSLLLS